MPLIRSMADLMKEIFLLTNLLVILSDCNAYSTATTKAERRVNNEEQIAE